MQNRNVPGKKMTARTTKSIIAEEIAAIEELMGDLDKRMRRLSGAARRESSGTSDEVGDFVNQALERIMNRVKASAADASQSITDETKRFGSDAIQKLTEEVEHRPLLILAVAAGIGFLAGLANRR